MYHRGRAGPSARVGAGGGAGGGAGAGDGGGGTMKEAVTRGELCDGAPAEEEVLLLVVNYYRPGGNPSRGSTNSARVSLGQAGSTRVNLGQPGSKAGSTAWNHSVCRGFRPPPMSRQSLPDL